MDRRSRRAASSLAPRCARRPPTASRSSAKDPAAGKTYILPGDPVVLESWADVGAGVKALVGRPRGYRTTGTTTFLGRPAVTLAQDPQRARHGVRRAADSGAAGFTSRVHTTCARQTRVMRTPGGLVLGFLARCAGDRPRADAQPPVDRGPSGSLHRRLDPHARPLLTLLRSAPDPRDEDPRLAARAPRGG